ncbi:hypothetical protein G7046_g7990 [Stylonectria norvegica]|nr:hypothetical protein G7046_g7990 [Stylonectria norvegica]
MEAASNTHINALQALIDEIAADAGEETASWKFWAGSPKDIAQARQDRLLRVLNAALRTRATERERITEVLQTLNKDALTGSPTKFRGSICRIKESILGEARDVDDVDDVEDAEHVNAMAKMMCLASERSDPRWKRLLRRIDKNKDFLGSVKERLSHEVDGSKGMNKRTRSEAQETSEAIKNLAKLQLD